VEQVEVSLADIARIAGVRATAVSNWRRRHDDFPGPVGGTDRSPRFNLAEVENWLRDQGKTTEIPANERLWQAFDSVRGVLSPVDALVSVGTLLYYLHLHPGTPVPRDPGDLTKLMARAQHALTFGGGTVTVGLMDVLRPFDLGAREVTLLHAVAEAAVAGDPVETFEYLCSRYLDTGARAGVAATPPELAEIMLDLAGPGRRCLFDPACGSGTILLAAGRRGYKRIEGQELNGGLAMVTALRLALADHPGFDVHAGDSLRRDAYQLRSADAVVCNPPFGDRNWGQEELSSDPRWEYDVPSRLESELAWVQHALAHAVPGGSVVILMPPAAAARPSGRRVRANLLRRGALRAVISLPPRLAAHYAVALQIWVLQRPVVPMAQPDLLFIDASGFSPDERRQGGRHTDASPSWDGVRSLINRIWTAFAADPAYAGELSEHALAVPVVDLLDDEVDVTPGRHVLASSPPRVTPDELTVRHEVLTGMIARLAELMPELPGPGRVQNGIPREMSLEELADTGAIFIRRAGTRPADDAEEHALPLISGRVLTASDLARAVPPSEVAQVVDDELRNPSIRAGDVLVPTVGRRLIARVAADQDVGAYLAPTVLLIRTDASTVDPWFLAGNLSSSDGGRQATRMTSTLSEHIRFDPRRVRIALLPISVQRDYGEAFRRLWEFARTLRSAHDLGIAFVRDMIDVTAVPLAETAEAADTQRSVPAKS
jgi:hypothetical protein